jgi:aspartyl-tRNA(Asn)/glutamyl-tRNA(Gln) amidotransferase subunit C
MSAEFTRDNVSKVAALANLELSGDELDLFARQLARILAYAEDVLRVDTTGVAPTATVVARLTPERADEVRPSLSVEEAIANAPDAAPDAGLFKVPRVIG